MGTSIAAAPPARAGQDAVWLSADDAAARRGVSHWTVRRWVKAGRLPVTRAHDGSLWFRVEDVDAVGILPAPAAVTVTCAGLDAGAWSVTIDGQTIGGAHAESRTAAAAALWDPPERGGLIDIDGVGSIPVPHRAAGRAASITLAGLAMVPGGDTVTVTVRPSDDPSGAGA